MRRLVLLATMDELDKSRMSFRWRSERSERRRDFVYFILEKSSVHHCTVAPPTPYAGGQGRRPRESQRGR